MRIARKILLPALTALAAMAFAASTASAQTPVEFEDEAGNDCSPCLVHIEGETHIRDRTQVGAPIITECHDEFDATLWHDGTGEIEWHGEDHPDAPIGCFTINCDHAVVPPEEEHWPVSGVGEIATDTVQMTLRVCFNNLHCNWVNIPATEIGHHQYEFTMHQRCFGGAREFEGHWETEVDEITGENNQDFEIDHTPDPN